MSVISMQGKEEYVELPLGRYRINWINFETDEMGCTCVSGLADGLSNVYKMSEVYDYINSKGGK